VWERWDREGELNSDREGERCRESEREMEGEGVGERGREREKRERGSEREIKRVGWYVRDEIEQENRRRERGKN
jgi:hypothetical protein